MKKIANVRLPVFVVFAVLFTVFILLKRKRALIYTVVTAVAFTVGFVECLLRLNAYDLCEINADTVYYITGKVAEKGVSGSREYVILSGVTADGKSAENLSFTLAAVTASIATRAIKLSSARR